MLTGALEHVHEQLLGIIFNISFTSSSYGFHQSSYEFHQSNYEYKFKTDLYLKLSRFYFFNSYPRP